MDKEGEMDRLDRQGEIETDRKRNIETDRGTVRER